MSIIVTRAYNPATETFLGSDCSGSNGDTNRVLTLNNTTFSSRELIFVQGVFLHSADYNIIHRALNSTITFLNPIWDSNSIFVRYFIPISS